MSDEPLISLWANAHRLAWWLCGDADEATRVVVRAAHRSWTQARRYRSETSRAAWFTRVVLDEAMNAPCLGPLTALPFRQRAAWVLLERMGHTTRQVAMLVTVSAEGARELSLGACPMAGVPRQGDRRLLRAIFHALYSWPLGNQIFGFRNLHRFKEKFRPRWEPVHFAASRLGPLELYLGCRMWGLY